MSKNWIVSDDGIWMNLDHANMGYVFERKEEEKPTMYEVRFNFPGQNGHLIISCHSDKESAVEFLKDLIRHA